MPPRLDESWKDLTTSNNSNNIWLPNTPQQTVPYDLSYPELLPVKARCYRRSCDNETRVVTELKLGNFQIKTYICEACLVDLAEKIKNELGIEEEEEK